VEVKASWITKVDEPAADHPRRQQQEMVLVIL
jgi:hypothetical protein